MPFSNLIHAHSVSLRGIHWLVMILACALLAGCNSVPGSGRNQLNRYSVEQEIRMGSDVYDQMIEDVTILEDGPEVEMIDRVTRRIAVSAERLHPGVAEDFEWEVVVIDDDSVANAWALPGGKMAVYTGLLPYTKNEDGLAVVMGHEAAHAIARHGGENMTRAAMVGLIAVGASVTMDDDAQPYIGATAAAYGLLGEPAFSRVQESEADELGLMISAAAGYDPREAIKLWERMAADSDGTPEFLSTHPSENTRIEKLQAVMPQAMALYREALAGQNAASE